MLGFLHAKNMTSVNSFENLHFSQFLGLHFELWMRSEFCVLKWLSDKITGKPGYMPRVNCIQEGTFPTGRVNDSSLLVLKEMWTHSMQAISNQFQALKLLGWRK